MTLQEIIDTLINNAPSLVVEHLQLVFLSVGLAVLIALPLGILLSREKFKPYLPTIISFFNIAQGVPSLAVIAIFMPILGIGFTSAVVALTIYALLPIIRNTLAGLGNLDQDIIEAAKGMGMPAGKVLLKIELPLALPVIIAGIQTATVVTVGTAILADLIGAGGLGRMIFAGISMFEPARILVGSLLSAIIAISLDQALKYIKTKLTVQFQ
ncbi:ABC transporter permease [Halanaerobiaceae bacterium Z-7014]|uniref:ABC transporter permease n=1 Tax=Halonatronomonas betaini TaxID=2778430 RepID=A0A931API7_9FIRM|nr:ABC transporter permease [Halonatronomonas betaini]MBF8435664.1 ABC transporter permease [Halonatronomonas betaini]